MPKGLLDPLIFVATRSVEAFHRGDPIACGIVTPDNITWKQPGDIADHVVHKMLIPELRKRRVVTPYGYWLWLWPQHATPGWTTAQRAPEIHDAARGFGYFDNGIHANSWWHPGGNPKLKF